MKTRSSHIKSSNESKPHALLQEAKSFHTKKKLGQNFLIDQDKLNEIVECLELKDGDNVIEIGCGIGFLTKALAKHNIKITAIDLDRECIEHIEKMHLKNVKIVHGNFLDFDLSPVSSHGKLKIVGNVPYQITGRIIGHLLGEIGQPSKWIPEIQSIVLTVQKEVAKRLIAKPNSEDYSKVSILMNYFGQADIKASIDPNSFYPKPEVHSAIVKITPKYPISLPCKNHILLRQVIEAGFRQRRKMLKNNLAFTHLNPSDINKIFHELSLDLQVRAESLSLAKFAQLADLIEVNK